MIGGMELKTRILSLFCALMLLSVLTLPVGAAVDTTKRGSIAVNMKHDGKEIPGGELTLYRVARINGTHYEYLPDYASCEVPLHDLSSAQLPAALAALVKTKNLQGTAGTIDSHGKLKFADLETGLYLIIQTKAAEGFHAVNPFLVTLPGSIGGRYVYDVDASPKLELVPKETTKPTETTPPTTTTPGTYIPQTGQTNWPIPALTVGGLFCIGFGWCLRKKKTYEK